MSVNSLSFCKPLSLVMLIIAAFFSASGTPVSLLNQNKATLAHNNPSKLNEAGSTIAWQPCTQKKFVSWFNSYADIGALECAVIDIPITNGTLQTTVGAAVKSSVLIDDTSMPNPADSPTTIKLAVSRLPATGSKRQKLGTLISIAGGPGQSGLDVSPRYHKQFERLSKHFDIIGYAPRGVSPTTPTIACDTTQYDLDEDDSDDAIDFVRACWEQTPHDLLAQLGADYAVEDVEAIRRALGDDKINLIGYSYGTKIAALYAEKYPQHLRAGVLDGVVDLNEPDMHMRMHQEASIQNSFERFVERCHKQYGCYFDDTKTLAAAEAKIAKLYHKIEAREEVGLDGERIYPYDLSREIYGLLLWPEQWPLLNDLLYQLEDGEYALLKELILYSKQDIDEATIASISCADVAPNEVQKRTYLQDIKRANSLSTWDNYRPFSDDEMLDGCYFWPIEGVDITHIPKLSPLAPSLLLVAQTNDPATPYANAVAMQHYLDAVLVTREGDGHTLALFDSSVCVDKTVVDYLINPDDFAKRNDKNISCED